MLSKKRWLFVLVLGSALLFPMLGSFGLWDPLEIQHADLAQEVARTGAWKDVTLDGRYDQRPVLYVWLVATGFKLFGVNEFAGRLPLALLGLLTLLLVFRAGRRLFSDEAGLMASLVLLTSPVFLFQCRQLESFVPYYFSVVASIGGLGAFLWPVDGRRCRIDLAIGAAGLVLGFLSHSLVLGTAFPLATLLLTVVLCWNLARPSTATVGLSDAALPEQAGAATEGTEAGLVSANPKPADTVGRALRENIKPLALALIAAGAAIGLLLVLLGNRNMLLLGGAWRRLIAPPTFEIPFRNLGWGFFPWVALLPVVLGRFLADQHRDPLLRTPDAFVKVLIVILTAGGYVLATFYSAYLGEVRFPALPWLAIGVGVFLAEVRVRSEQVHRFVGLTAIGLVLVIHQDYFMQPESLAFSHIVGSQAKYPLELSIKIPVRVFGILLALFMFLGFGGVPRTIEPEFGSSFLGRLLARLARWVDIAGESVRMIFGATGQRARLALMVTALVFAGFCAFYLTPSLSLHMSNKALFGTFHKCKSGAEHLAQYQVPGRGAAYYNNGQVEDVGDQEQLFRLLQQDKRWFILVPSGQLAPIDQAARQRGIAYYVLDDRSSQYLIVSNRLEGQCAVDHNPLRKFVLQSPPKVRHPLRANFDNKVELLGYDVDDIVTRGTKFTITLYFKVTGRMPGGYKFFLHFDQPANRFHGDHDPLGGKFPTEYWMPGDFIVDTYEVDIPFITTPAGEYQIYMGFWLGDDRIKVVEGPNDGVNRVPLGILRVR